MAQGRRDWQILCEVWLHQCGARDDCIMGRDFVNMVSVPTFQRNLLSEICTLNRRAMWQVCKLDDKWSFLCKVPCGSSASVVIRTTGANSPVSWWTLAVHHDTARLCDLLTHTSRGCRGKVCEGLLCHHSPPYVSTAWCLAKYKGSLHRGCAMQISPRWAIQLNVLCVGTDSQIMRLGFLNPCERCMQLV